jgi:hypothetical protein
MRSLTTSPLKIQKATLAANARRRGDFIRVGRLSMGALMRKLG